MGYVLGFYPLAQRTTAGIQHRLGHDEGDALGKINVAVVSKMDEGCEEETNIG